MASRANADRPVFWIVAGPNGSGKSSAYQDSDIESFARTVWIINPDLLTARICAGEGLALDVANREAVERIEVWLEASINAYQTVGVETVMSTDKYRRLVLEAKKREFQVRLTYVILDSPQRCITRSRSYQEGRARGPRRQDRQSLRKIARTNAVVPGTGRQRIDLR